MTCRSRLFLLSSHGFLFHPLPFFFFNDTATTEIYTLSLHDALPIFPQSAREFQGIKLDRAHGGEYGVPFDACPDRKSTRLNSSHLVISYAVFCLKKKTRTGVQHLPRVGDSAFAVRNVSTPSRPCAAR